LQLAPREIRNRLARQLSKAVLAQTGGSGIRPTDLHSRRTDVEETVEEKKRRKNSGEKENIGTPSCSTSNRSRK
jgi:hypothetical protein